MIGAKLIYDKVKWLMQTYSGYVISGRLFRNLFFVIQQEKFLIGFLGQAKN